MQVLMRLASASALLVSEMCLCTLICGCVRTSGHGQNRYQGDGRFVDLGPESFPRYRLALPTISLEASRKERFQIGAFPRFSATVLLALEGPSVSHSHVLAERESQVKNLPIRLVCRLMDPDGIVVADTETSGTDWHVSASINRTRLWHDDLRDISIRSGCLYYVEIEAEVSGAVPDGLTITPLIEGGGRERL